MRMVRDEHFSKLGPPLVVTMVNRETLCQLIDGDLVDPHLIVGFGDSKFDKMTKPQIEFMRTIYTYNLAD
jgi:hypothetical protein